MKIDLKDCTFAIPIRIDSQDRLDNIKLITTYLKNHFDTNVIVIENDSKSNLEGQDFIKDVEYFFQKNDSNIFHRTKILNDILEMTETPYWVNYDCDVLFPVKSYLDAANLMRSGSAFVFPYLGPFHEIPRKFIPTIYEKMEVDWIDLTQTTINHPSSVGGAMFMDTNIYKSLGGEVELSVGWGWEDSMRVLIFHKFGHVIKRCGTVLYHMEHWRGHNSGPSNPHHNQNHCLYGEMCSWSQEQWIEYIMNHSRFEA